MVLNTAADPGLHSWAQLARSKTALEPAEPLALEDWQGKETGNESLLVGFLASYLLKLEPGTISDTLV